jgi:hypothetical protein
MFQRLVTSFCKPGTSRPSRIEEDIMRWVLIMAAIAGCVPPAQPSQYPNENQSEMQPQQPARDRHITINGARLGSQEAATLADLEAAGGVTLPDGSYWYDPVSGGFGEWGKPLAVLIGPGYVLGPKLPANASGGTSRVYINGRRLQVAEVNALSAITRFPWQPGHYFVDGQGNAGVEGGPILVNLIAVVQAQQTNGNVSAGKNSWTMGAEHGFSVGLGGYDRGSFYSDGNCRTYSDTKGNVISSGC